MPVNAAVLRGRAALINYLAYHVCYFYSYFLIACSAQCALYGELSLAWIGQHAYITVSCSHLVCCQALEVYGHRGACCCLSAACACSCNADCDLISVEYIMVYV